jgi:hypothetical protein
MLGMKWNLDAQPLEAGLVVQPPRAGADHPSGPKAQQEEAKEMLTQRPFKLLPPTLE